jgi:hypothetical protein
VDHDAPGGRPGVGNGVADVLSPLPEAEGDAVRSQPQLNRERALLSPPHAVAARRVQGDRRCDVRPHGAFLRSGGSAANLTSLAVVWIGNPRTAPDGSLAVLEYLLTLP